MGHIRLTGDTIEHITSNGSDMSVGALKIKNNIAEAAEALHEIQRISTGVSDTTESINNYLQENYNIVSELYPGSSPYTKAFIHKMVTTITYDDNGKQHVEIEEIGNYFVKEAHDFAELASNDSRVISVEIDESPKSYTTIEEIGDAQVRTVIEEIDVKVTYIN